MGKGEVMTYMFLVLVILLLLMYAGSDTAKGYYHFYTDETVLAKGQVIGVDSERLSAHSGNYCRLTYAYNANGERYFSKNYGLGVSLSKEECGRRYKVGDVIDVQYFKESPSVSYVRIEDSYYPFFFLLMGAFVGFLLGGIIYVSLKW